VFGHDHACCEFVKLLGFTVRYGWIKILMDYVYCMTNMHARLELMNTGGSMC
jgi:hypothetical protein